MHDDRPKKLFLPNTTWEVSVLGGLATEEWWLAQLHHHKPTASWLAIYENLPLEFFEQLSGSSTRESPPLAIVCCLLI